MEKDKQEPTKSRIHKGILRGKVNKRVQMEWSVSKTYLKGLQNNGKNPKNQSLKMLQTRLLNSVIFFLNDGGVL